MGELRDGAVFLERGPDEGPIVIDEGVMGVSVVGAGDPDDLAREAAEVHFRTHPDRSKVLIIVSTRTNDNGWVDT
jgi:hypothetical protein